MRRGSFAAALAGIACFAGPAASDSMTLRVAMLPIVVNSNLADTAYLSHGLEDMIAARLEQSGEIAIDRLEKPAGDREAAIEAARAAGAEYVVFGSYTQFGDGASLDIRCAPVEEEEEDAPRRVFIQAGSPGEIIPKLGDLAQRVTDFLLSGAVSAAPRRATAAAPASSSDDLGAIVNLQDRVEALERVVFAKPRTEEPTGAATAEEPPADEGAAAE